MVQREWVKRAQRTGVIRDEVDREGIMSFSSIHPALPVHCVFFDFFGRWTWEGWWFKTSPTDNDTTSELFYVINFS